METYEKPYCAKMFPYQDEGALSLLSIRSSDEVVRRPGGAKACTCCEGRLFSSTTVIRKCRNNSTNGVRWISESVYKVRKV